MKLNGMSLERVKKEASMPDGFEPLGLNQEKLLAQMYQRVLNMPQPMSAGSWVNGARQKLRQAFMISYTKRFNWFDLPIVNVNSRQLEIMLYKHSPVGVFFSRDIGWIATPVGIRGGDKDIPVTDYNGNVTYAFPVPFRGTETIVSGEKTLELAKIGKRKVLWDIPTIKEDITGSELLDFMEEHCVLIYDTTPEYQSAVTVQETLDIPFIDGCIEAMQATRTAMVNAIGTSLVRVSSKEEADAVDMQLMQMQRDTLNGKRYFPVMTLQDLQSPTPPQVSVMQDFWGNFQSIKNLRDTLCGISNDGVQQKEQYQNIQSQAIDLGASDSMLLDGWESRVFACALMNALWGLQVTCESVRQFDPNAVGGDGQEQGGDSNEQPNE